MSNTRAKRKRKQFRKWVTSIDEGGLYMDRHRQRVIPKKITPLQFYGKVSGSRFSRWMQRIIVNIGDKIKWLRK